MRNLPFKVYDADGEGCAATMRVRDALRLCFHGYSVRYMHRILWREGEEDVPAAQDLDNAERTALARVGIIERGRLSIARPLA